ncbi:MAG: hypothetical protein JWP46_2246, partial [Modestobacter sp.]|nr:hypothetical protein [Modestobacter sp.]
MHEDDAELRSTLVRFVLDELRAGRPRLTPPARAALHILAAEPPAPGPDGALLPRRLRRAAAAAGLGLGITGLAGGLLLGTPTDSPHTPSGPPPIEAAPVGTAPPVAADDAAAIPSSTAGTGPDGSPRQAAATATGAAGPAATRTAAPSG